MIFFLGLIWPPLAIIAVSLLISQLVKIATINRLVVLSVCSLLFYILRETSGEGVWSSQGFFPATSIAYFTVLLAVAILISNVLNMDSYQSALISVGWMALSGVIGLFVFFKSPWSGFVELTNNTGVTPYYYQQKLIWLFTIPLVFIVASLTTSMVSRDKIPIGTGTAILFCLTASSVLLSANSNIWIPQLNSYSKVMAGQKVLQYDQKFGETPVMYFEFGGWPIDSTLNAWSGVRWETQITNSEPTQGPRNNSGPFGNREWFTGQPGDDSLCNGLSLIPVEGILVSSSTDIASRIEIACPEHLKNLKVVIDFFDH